MILGDSILAVVAILVAIIGCLLTGLLVTGVQYRDMRQERDYYRETSQTTALALAAAQGQIATILAVRENEQ